MRKECHGSTSFEEVGSFAANEICDSHSSGKDQPSRRPEKREIYLAEWVGKKRRIVIGMPVCHEERRLTLDSWKARAEVISKTIGNTTRAEHAVLMREFAVNRVDVIVVIYSNEAANLA